MRKAGTKARPNVDLITAMASRLPDSASGTSEPGSARGIALDVPRWSQMTHTGHYSRWGGGGEAWCSPTATSMVMGYWDSLPKAKKYDWVGDGHPQPWVDHAARQVFDHAYDGAGNWPFNTAYAARWTGKAFVTRLRTLRHAEKFIRAGIPLVASLAWRSGELDNAAIGSSAGHLVVIVGFDQEGNVVVNDPAGATSSEVRRTYRRDQFERLWLEASGGTVYVIHPKDVSLPGGKRRSW